MVTFDVLISTIPHRHEKLCGLLAEFDRQRQPGFGVRVLRDNLERFKLESHGKRQDLIESSAADYVCFVDDDDWVDPRYVGDIMAALEHEPDYVGFQVVITRDGKPDRLAEHSLEHTGWSSWHDPDRLLRRDICHLNPIRRELALLAPWHGLMDFSWAEAMRDTGRVKTQVMVERPLGQGLYHYRINMKDNFETGRNPEPEPLPELPSYPWLTVL